jgi:hypothetical protein
LLSKSGTTRNKGTKRHFVSSCCLSQCFPWAETNCNIVDKGVWICC